MGGEIRHSGHDVGTSQDHPRVAFGMACSAGAADARCCTLVRRAWATAIKGRRSAGLKTLRLPYTAAVLARPANQKASNRRRKRNQTRT